MSSISKFLEADHARCDALFESAQAHAEQQDWQQAAADFHAFDQALSRHLAMEEDVLFPTFERVSGNTSGPTAVMRIEHQRLRDLIEAGNAALAARETTDFLASAEALQILMGQHNLKEESILYPITDRVLASQVDAVLQAMQAVENRSAGAQA
jgi:hemerythrin-like domain-containing protein